MDLEVAAGRIAVLGDKISQNSAGAYNFNEENSDKLEDLSSLVNQMKSIYQ